MPLNPNIIQFKDAQTDASIYPVGLMEAVFDSSSANSMYHFLEEYNVSAHHLNSVGNRNGKDLFIFSEAIARVPADYKHNGLTVTFKTDNNGNGTYHHTESWVFKGTSTTDTNWNNANNWVEFDRNYVDLADSSIRSDLNQLGQKSIELFPIQYSDSSDADNDEDINIVDYGNNILATINKDGLKTKKFNTEQVVYSTKLGEDDADSLIIQDKNSNILAVISKDGLKTKNFDSSRIDEDYSGEVTIENSDCITILGSSFGETNAFPTNKHWSGIMSLFSDYVIQNLSLSGSNIVTNLYFIRTGQWVIRGKYVAITNNENLSTMDITQYIHALDNLCSTLKGLNKIPIICTNYHKAPYFCLALKKYAYDNNLMFWDASDYCHTLVPAIYGGFDDGAHLRKRNAPMVADAYLNNMHEMSAPFSSIKLFTLRDSGFSGSIDNLIYNNNVERAKLFREIKISSTQAQDEYNKIISKTSVSFGKYGTIDCVLPTFARQLKELWLELDTNNTPVSVYVKNTLAEPYPNPSTASVVRFSVSDTINIPMAGDVYSVGGTNYTISQIIMGENGYYCTIYCSPATLPASATGTLSVVSRVEGSTGSTSIDYALAEISTLNIGTYISSDNQGHWVGLTLTDGKYEVPSVLFNGTIQNDKVSFLIVAASTSFSIKDVKLQYKAYAVKSKESDGHFEWFENDYYHTDELVSEPTFGEVGTELTSWTGDNNSPIVSVGDYGSKYPFGANSIVKVTDALAMNTTITDTELNKFGKAVLEICCRYFPNAPTPYSQSGDTEINDNSYDYNTLFITMTQTRASEKLVLQEEIGVMWKIIRIPLTWFWQLYDNSAYLHKSINLRLSSNDKGIEIAKVSLKYINQ